MFYSSPQTYRSNFFRGSIGLFLMEERFTFTIVSQEKTRTTMRKSTEH